MLRRSRLDEFRFFFKKYAKTGPLLLFLGGTRANEGRDERLKEKFERI